MKYLLVCISSLCVVLLHAAEGFSLDKVKEANAEVSTMRLSFVQEQHLALWEEPLETTGVIEIDRVRGAVRWAFDGGVTLILADGGLRRWDVEGREESLGGRRNPGVDAMARQMEALLAGDWSGLEETFTVVPDPDGSPAVTLKPRSKDVERLISGMAIRFRSDFQAPEVIRINAEGGDHTLYRFAEPAVNIEFEEARFVGP